MHVSASGQFKDPTDENEAVSGSSQHAAASKEQEEVSASATSNENAQSGSGQQALAHPQNESQSARAARSEQTEKTGFAALMQFLLEAAQETKKITWPDRKQVLRETLSVIVLVALITGAVLGFDYAIAKVVFEPLDKFARQMGGGIGVHH